jgi:preprotein translocase subunit SecG
MDILTTLLYIVFVIAAIVLIVVILLQEGRGGGFGQALGEHGQQTFGVGARGINTFTGYTAAVFLVSALVLHTLNRGTTSSSVLDGVPSVQDGLPPGFPGADGGGGAGVPIGGGTQPGG